MWLATALIAVGICLIIGRAITGDPIPYAPGDETSSARAVARTSTGYKADSMTVYEGQVSAIRVIPLAGPDSHGVINFPYGLVSLTSGAPEIRVQGSYRQPLPSLSVGEVVRIWTTSYDGWDLDSHTSYRTTSAWRVDTARSRWSASGYIPASVPRHYEGGFGPVKTAIYFGGVPIGLLVGFVGFLLLYRSAIQVSAGRSRTVDTVAVLCGAWAVFVICFGIVLINSLFIFTLLFVSAALGISGLIAGVIGLLTRKKGQLWWPSAAGAVAGLASVAFAAFIVMEFATHSYG